MQQLRLLLLVAALWPLALARVGKTAKAASQDDVVDVQQALSDAKVEDDQMPMDYYQQAVMQQPYPQPVYGQGYYQQPVQASQQPMPAVQQQPVQQPPGQAAYGQPVQYIPQQPVQGADPGQGIPQQSEQTANPVVGLPEQAVQASSPLESLPQPPVQVSSGPDGADLTIPLKPADGSQGEAAGAGSHLHHETKVDTEFSLCDIMPPPWNIICYIIQFIFFTWPMYYIWIGLICLIILQQIYVAFKETLDPIIIAILDAIYLVVWVVVRVCQFIWMCIKQVVYPIKESMIRCSDGIDFHLNPWKRRTPTTHVPGFSY